MGNVTIKEFHWSYTDEPHATRRKEILAKYPQIKDLYGFDYRTKYIVTFWIVTQLAFAYLLRDANWLLLLTIAYAYGGFASQALALAMHEISHNLGFAKPLHNRLLGIYANFVTVFPHFSMFQKYHMEHHQYQGVTGIDVDIPSELEGRIFTNSLLKLVWVFLQPAFYAIRPLLIKPKKAGFWDITNWICVISFDIAVYYVFGVKTISYLALSMILGCGLHPVAGHFIAEHYVFVKGQETYSYYGPLNFITFNVGYHNEHHDFPRIPGYKLPTLRAICPEYYDNLPSYNSWTKVIYDYIMDPTIGPYSRVMRKSNKAPKSE